MTDFVWQRPIGTGLYHSFRTEHGAYSECGRWRFDAGRFLRYHLHDDIREANDCDQCFLMVADKRNASIGTITWVQSFSVCSAGFNDNPIPMVLHE